MELPVDIILDILTRLPTESVLESKLVCKTWRDVVRHSSFSQKHLNRLISSSSAAEDSGNLGFLLTDEEWASKGFYYIECNENNEAPITNPRKINLGRLDLELSNRSCNVADSCNGLICLISLCQFIVCNPITREFVVLPDLGLCSTYGFGYLASTNEYKVVRIFESQEDHIAQVYTLGSGNGWRNVGRLKSVFLSNRRGVLLNGALHWMISEKQASMAFDLADEKFREISLPKIPHPYRHNRNKEFNLLGSFGDSLMCVDYRGLRSGKSLGIWLLKENGICNMWEVSYKSMSLNEESDVVHMEPFAFTNSGVVLCYKASTSSDPKIPIYRYDFKLSSLEMLGSYDKQVFWPPSAYMKTLVSLKALGEENTRRME